VSQSPLQQTSPDADDPYLQAWQGLALRIQQGSSFSGRERNCCFLNTRGQRFADVSSALGLDQIDDSRAVAASDWDHDGDVDLLVTNRTGPRIRFLRNDLGNQSAYVSFRLIGDPRQSTPRDAAGARVAVRFIDDAGRRQTVRQTMYAGDGFLSQSSKWIHIGLGKARSIEQVEVRWPGHPDVQTFAGLQLNGRYLLDQRRGTAKKVLGRDSIRLASSEVAAPQATSRSRLCLSRPVKSSPIEFQSLDGQAQTLEPTGRVRLITLWATWCAPCLEELDALSTRSAELERLGVDVIALSVEAIDSDFEAARQAVAEWKEQSQFKLLAGIAERSTIAQLHDIRRRTVYRQRPMSIPASFLLDRQGKVRVIYTGQVEFQQLAADMGQLDADPHRWKERSVPFAGRWSSDLFVTHPIAIASIFRQEGQLAEGREYLNQYLEFEPEPKPDDQSEAAFLARRRLADVHHLLGKIASDTGDVNLAETEYRKGLSLYPKLTDALIDLGKLRFAAGDWETAASLFEEAITINRGDPDAHNQLGLVRMKQRRTEEAIGEFETALRINSNWLPAANNLAWLRATCSEKRFREPAQAIRLAERLAQATANGRADILDTLGAAYAADGQFERAVETVRRAIELAKQESNSSLEQLLTERLRLYESGQALVE
jgi:tetratricopeptide (TPR) repeat protein